MVFQFSKCLVPGDGYLRSGAVGVKIIVRFLCPSVQCLTEQVVLPASLSSGIARGSVSLEKSLRAMPKLLSPNSPHLLYGQNSGW